MLDRLSRLATPLTLGLFAVAIGLLEFVVRPQVGEEYQLWVNVVGFSLAIALFAIGASPLIQGWFDDREE